jgi:hypothetical protein
MVHDERTPEELRERNTTSKRNYVSADRNPQPRGEMALRRRRRGSTCFDGGAGGTDGGPSSPGHAVPATDHRLNSRVGAVQACAARALSECRHGFCDAWEPRPVPQESRLRRNSRSLADYAVRAAQAACSYPRRMPAEAVTSANIQSGECRRTNNSAVLAASLRDSQAIQPNTCTMIRYSSRNTIARASVRTANPQLIALLAGGIGRRGPRSRNLGAGAGAFVCRNRVQEPCGDRRGVGVESPRQPAEEVLGGHRRPVLW